jgi:hypothetical protein
MDRKARNSVLLGPSTRSGTASRRLTGLIGPAGHAHHQPGHTDLEFRLAQRNPGAVPPGVTLLGAASPSEETTGFPGELRELRDNLNAHLRHPDDHRNAAVRGPKRRQASIAAHRSHQ